VKRLTEVMVEIERDVDTVGVRVKATPGFIVGGSKMRDQGLV